MTVRATLSLIVACGIAVAVITLVRPVAAQQPTFQTTVNFVDVDVTVADAQGNFVSGLTADDFEVFEDGKPQKIQTFSYIELPVERPDRYRFAGQPVPDDVRSNRDVSSGRVYIILLDDLNVAPLRTNIVRRHAREFIERQFGPHDLAAVVVTSGRKDAAQEFTSDPALLLRAVDSFIGQRLQSAKRNASTTTINRSRSHRRNKASATCWIRCNRSIRRIWSGASAPSACSTRCAASPNFWRSARGGGRRCSVQRRHRLPMAEVFSSQSGNEINTATRDAISAAAQANVNIFALDPRGLIGMTTDFVENMRAGAPDVMGTDRNSPSVHPRAEHRRCSARCGSRRTACGRWRKAQEASRLSIRTRLPKPSAASPTRTAGTTARVRAACAPAQWAIPPHRSQSQTPGLSVVARRGYPSPRQDDGRAQTGCARAMGQRSARRRLERHLE
jgi:VWFA-related protein